MLTSHVTCLFSSGSKHRISVLMDSFDEVDPCLVSLALAGWLGRAGILACDTFVARMRVRALFHGRFLEI